jgi:long-chain fatty acid transport protein
VHARWNVPLALVVLACASTAAANPMDTFGFTSRAISMGGAATAGSVSYEAAYYNPAALSKMDKGESGIGFLVWQPFLTAHQHATDTKTGTIRGADVSRGDTGVLIDTSFASPIPIGKYKHLLFLGTDVEFPGLALYKVRALPLTEPNFPFLEDRNNRLVLNVAVALRPIPQFAIGAGFSLLPNVDGSVKVDFTNAGQANATSVDVGMHLSPNVGLMAVPIPGLTLGLAWRGENRTHLDIPVQANLATGVAPLYLDVLAYDYWTPHQLSFGIAWATHRYTVSGDLTWSFYRGFNQSAPTVHVLDASGNVVQGAEVPGANFHDSAAIRVGAEYRVIEPLLLRAGFAWIQSPVPAQTGVTNLLDGDRWTASLGLGFDGAGAGVPFLKIDVHVAAAFLTPNTDPKMSLLAGNPGYPNIGESGWMLNTGMTIRLGF